MQIELSGFEYGSAKARFGRGPICVQYLTVMNFKTIIYCQLLCWNGSEYKFVRAEENSFIYKLDLLYYKVKLC